MSDRATAWILIGVLWLAGLGAAAQYAKISAIYDILQASYGDIGAALGFAVSLVGVVGVVFGVVSGMLVARITYRTALLWALWIGALASATQAVMPNFWLFLASRVVEGASHLAIVVAAPTLMTMLSARRHVSTVMTLWSTFFGVAFALTVFAGRPLAEAAGVPALFISHAGALALIALVLSRAMPRLPQEDPRLIGNLAEIARQHMRIYRSPWIGAPAVGWLCFAFASIAILTLLRPFIAPGWQTLVMVAIPLLSIASALTLGLWLVTRRGAIWTVEFGFLLCAGLAAAFLILPGAPLICLLLAVAMGCVQAASFASIPELNPAPKDGALAHGAMAQTGNLGNLVSPRLLAWAIGIWEGPGLVVGLTTAFALGAGAHFALDRRRRTPKRGTMSTGHLACSPDDLG